MHKVTRYEFLPTKAGRVVVYISIVATPNKNGMPERNAYMSIHKMGDLNETAAKKAFHVEHSKEVDHLLLERKLNQLNKNNGKSISESNS